MGNSSENYKSIRDIINSLNDAVDALESGRLSVEDLDALLQDSRSLTERIAILQYVAQRPEKKEVKETPKKKSSMSFQLDFTKMEEERENEPTNQTNLLDAIEEEEVPDVVFEKSQPEIEKTAFQPEVNIEEDLIKEEERIVSAEESEKTTLEENSFEKVTEEIISKTSLENVANEEISSLNDRFSDQAEVTTLAEKLGKKPISDLPSAIGLNQKFLFMNDLFEGENTLYKEAINTLNNFSSYQEANNFMESLRSRHSWDDNASTVQKFIDLVQRRYS